MTIFQAIILGIIQGIAEFLPISSSGHLILFQAVFDMSHLENAFTFDIVVHAGTLVAIMAVFWQDIWNILKNPFSKMTGLLIVGSVPVAVVGFFFRGVIENFRGGLWLAIAFTITGCLLIFADKFTAGKKEARDMTYIDAIIVGCMQALALPPGISRSGTTIAGGLARGLSRETAARFSFLLAAISIAGVSGLETILVFTGETPNGYTVGMGAMIAGFIASAIVGYAAIKLLLKIVKAAKLRYFSYYVWALAAFILLDLLIFNLLGW
ncbi:MAG: undecaprenyl-diphosphate phosphatase [Defluviitaleaceae bacterium]|nr:undecaprenyl-diphosphate phosphatase [Defluviitaleaceae bacterium]